MDLAKVMEDFLELAKKNGLSMKDGITILGRGLITIQGLSLIHIYYIGTIGIPQKGYVNRLIEKSDLVIAVGYDIVEYAPTKWNGDANLRIIHIDTSAAHINKLYEPVVEVVGDISESLFNIIRRTCRKDEPEYALKIRKRLIEENKNFEDRCV